MKPLLLLVSIICVSATAYAQSGKVETVRLGEISIDVRGGSPRPDVDHGGAREGGGNQQGRVTDPYPALTQANAAYNQAVSVWQQAYQNYQTALAKQARLRERYVDSNNNVRAGFDYYAVVAVLDAANKEAQDAYLELSNAERAKNEAYSTAAGEFSKATEQYARAQREEAARKEAVRQEAIRRQQREGAAEHHHEHN